MIGWWAVADFLVGPVGRWLAILSAFVFAGALGFVKGIEYQEGKQAMAEVQVLTKRVEVVKKVQVGQERISAAFEKGRAEREAEFKKLHAEYEQNIRSVLAALPDACAWNDDIVGLLNRSRGAVRPSANPAKPSDPVSPARSAFRWETGIGGSANDFGRQAVSGLPGPAPAAN